jgi:hypothetical protein
VEPRRRLFGDVVLDDLFVLGGFELEQSFLLHAVVEAVFHQVDEAGEQEHAPMHQ